MADFINVSINALPPFENAPDFVKGSTSFKMNEEQLGQLADYVSRKIGKYVPVKILEGQNGNYLEIDWYRIGNEIKKHEANTNQAPVTSKPTTARSFSPKQRIQEDEVALEDLPF